jgi:outer membrane lipoprotein-sorting protein
VRRIAASKKGDAFMGTDFTYDDMGERKVEEDHHKLIKSETHSKVDCYLIESTPNKKGYIYSKKLTWVDKINWIPIKVDYYDRKGRFLKTLQTDWQQLDGIWTWEKAVMENHLSGHKTIIAIEEIKINTGLEDRVFMERTLKRGYKLK